MNSGTRDGRDADVKGLNLVSPHYATLQGGRHLIAANTQNKRGKLCRCGTAVSVWNSRIMVDEPVADCLEATRIAMDLH